MKKTLIASALAGSVLLAPITAQAAPAPGTPNIPGSSELSSSIISPETNTVIAQTNAFRASQGLPALAQDARLNATATAWAEYLALTNQFKHANLGLVGASAENIAKVSAVEHAVGAWENSPGHRANMVGAHRSVGIGIARAWDGQIIVVQEFGR